MRPVTVVGAGLAGCEASWQLAQRGIPVELFEMKPTKMSPAHHSPNFAELVCSNSLRGDRLENAVGLLKEELRKLDSLILSCADATKVEAGGALAVDRHGFSALVTERIRSHPLIHINSGEVTAIPEAPVIIATGPLTSEAMGEAIRQYFGGEDYLNFFDAAAPLITYESIDMDKAWFASRYDRGSADYINCAMEEMEYREFVRELAAAQEAAQIIEFTQVYQQYSLESYQAEKNPLVEWETAPTMVKAQGYTPALQANTPYINEATCIASASDRAQQERIMQLLDWLCSNEGNLWANFGQQGVGYTVENNQFQFLLYYDEEMTPNLDPSDGTIADITVGRMFTTTPWQSTGLENRYTGADQFAQNSGARIVLPAVLGNASAAVEDNTQLWRMDSIAEELNTLAMEFAETVKKDGFTAAGWTEYYQKLQQAGLSEYTQFMQKRAG